MEELSGNYNEIVFILLECVYLILLFRINQITGSESGQYRCAASNVAGSAEIIVNLVIQESPSVTLTPSGSVVVRPGDRQELVCRARGDPLPTVAWERYQGSGAASAIM